MASRLGKELCYDSYVFRKGKRFPHKLLNYTWGETIEALKDYQMSEAFPVKTIVIIPVKGD